MVYHDMLNIKYSKVSLQSFWLQESYSDAVSGCCTRIGFSVLACVRSG